MPFTMHTHFASNRFIECQLLSVALTAAARGGTYLSFFFFLRKQLSGEYCKTCAPAIITRCLGIVQWSAVVSAVNEHRLSLVCLYF